MPQLYSQDNPRTPIDDRVSINIMDEMSLETALNEGIPAGVAAMFAVAVDVGRVNPEATRVGLTFYPEIPDGFVPASGDWSPFFTTARFAYYLTTEVGRVMVVTSAAGDILGVLSDSPRIPPAALLPAALDVARPNV